MKAENGRVADQQSDLNGSAPDNHVVALLLIDVINDFQFPGGECLLENALPIAVRIRVLKARARSAGIPAMYVNDNFGRWQSDFSQLLKHSLEPGVRGRPFVEQLAPEEHDFFVLKPKHSAFYQTPLDILLKHLGARRLILTGLCTNSCVMFTGHDAFMRDLKLYVPPDCVATYSRDEQDYAIGQIKKILKADVSFSTDLDLNAIAADQRQPLERTI
jgi:nicotinamidase-related amidase